MDLDYCQNYFHPKNVLEYVFGIYKLFYGFSSSVLQTRERFQFCYSSSNYTWEDNEWTKPLHCIAAQWSARSPVFLSLGDTNPTQHCLLFNVFEGRRYQLSRCDLLATWNDKFLQLARYSQCRPGSVMEQKYLDGSKTPLLSCKFRPIWKTEYCGGRDAGNWHHGHFL